MYVFIVHFSNGTRVGNYLRQQLVNKYFFSPFSELKFAFRVT